MSGVNKVKKNQGWFYERYEYPQLLNKFKRDFRRKPTPSLAIAIIQLTNGARVSEAIEGYGEWIRTGRTEVEVRVRKKKNPETRKIVIPTFLREYRTILRSKRIPTRQAVFDLLNRRYGINTHTLRYTWITWHTETLSPAYISQIIRHGSIDMLLKYLSKRKADKLLEEIVP